MSIVKKIFNILLIITMILSMAACGSSAQDTSAESAEAEISSADEKTIVNSENGNAETITEDEAQEIAISKAHSSGIVSEIKSINSWTNEEDEWVVQLTTSKNTKFTCWIDMYTGDVTNSIYMQSIMLPAN